MAEPCEHCGKPAGLAYATRDLVGRHLHYTCYQELYPEGEGEEAEKRLALHRARRCRVTVGIALIVADAFQQAYEAAGGVITSFAPAS